MNKSIYYLGGLSLAVLLYINLPETSTPNTASQDAPILFKTKKNQNYAQVGLGYKDALVGMYKTTNATNHKDLILDSTYTYSYTVQEGDKTVVLEGSWELSYKNQDQHIILHRPLPKKELTNLAVADFDEHKLKVTEEGLKDLKKDELFIQMETDEYSLAIYE